MRRVLSAGLALLLAASVALAASDADRAQRVARLSEQLRCLVCQNQSIADSNAPLALDLKRRNLAAAAQYWERALAQLPAESPFAGSLRGSLDQARAGASAAGGTAPR